MNESLKSMALGIIASRLTVTGKVEARPEGVGFRYQTYLSFEKFKPAQLEMVKAWCQAENLVWKKRIHKKEIHEWMDKLDAVHHLFTDQRGLKKYLWWKDNPFPKTWEEFVLWAEKWDSLNDEI